MVDWLSEGTGNGSRQPVDKFRIGQDRSRVSPLREIDLERGEGAQLFAIVHDGGQPGQKVDSAIAAEVAGPRNGFRNDCGEPFLVDVADEAREEPSERLELGEVTGAAKYEVGSVPTAQYDPPALFYGRGDPSRLLEEVR